MFGFFRGSPQGKETGQLPRWHLALSGSEPASRDCSQPRGSGPLGPFRLGCFNLGRRALPSFFLQLTAPGPPRQGGAGRGRLLRDPASSCRHQPRLSCCCRLPPALRCGTRLRGPSPRSSHDGGCSQRRRAPGARWGRRARGGRGGRAGLALMFPFVSPQPHLLPWCAGPGDPAGRPGRRPRLPLGGGPRSKFCRLLALTGPFRPRLGPWV